MTANSNRLAQYYSLLILIISEKVRGRQVPGADRNHDKILETASAEKKEAECLSYL